MTLPEPLVARSLAAEQPTSLSRRLRYTTACALAGAVAGVLMGKVWAVLAAPPAGVLSSGGVAFGETQLNQQVGVTLWYLVAGFVGGVMLGLALAWRGYRHGVLAVMGVVLASVVASLVSYWTGVHVFGPDTKEQLASATEGQRITASLGVGTKIAFLGWPVGGLLGALLAIGWWPRRPPSSSAAPLRSKVVPH